jgi:hypothetical protein
MARQRSDLRSGPFSNIDQVAMPRRRIVGRIAGSDILGAAGCGVNGILSR